MAGYKIKSGDTLSQIAKRKGITLKALLGANPGIKNANKISVGQSIKIPSTSKMPGSKSDNPYKGMTQTQLNMMDHKNKSEKAQQAATRSMQTQVKEGGSQTSPTPSKTKKTIANAPHVNTGQKAMEKAKARRAAAQKKSANASQQARAKAGRTMSKYYSSGGSVFTGR